MTDDMSLPGSSFPSSFPSSLVKHVVGKEYLESVEAGSSWQPPSEATVVAEAIAAHAGAAWSAGGGDLGAGGCPHCFPAGGAVDGREWSPNMEHELFLSAEEVAEAFECVLAGVPAASMERLWGELMVLSHRSPVRFPTRVGPGLACEAPPCPQANPQECTGGGTSTQDPWARLAGLPLGEAAADVTYLLLGDPSDPAIDAEELQRLCSAGPEMSEEEYKTYMEGLRAILVQEWTSWGETPEAVDAMLAAEGRKQSVVPSAGV
jgi:hypothetical protein